MGRYVVDAGLVAFGALGAVLGVELVLRLLGR